MTNTAPALTGSDEIQVVDLRTDMEKRLDWLCDAWQDALEIDSHEEWHDVRMALYGARQAIIMGDGRHDELVALRVLGDTASQHCHNCIAAGDYEGAPK